MFNVLQKWIWNDNAVENLVNHLILWKYSGGGGTREEITGATSPLLLPSALNKALTKLLQYGKTE